MTSNMTCENTKRFDENIREDQKRRQQCASKWWLCHNCHIYFFAYIVRTIFKNLRNQWMVQQHIASNILHFFLVKNAFFGLSFCDFKPSLKNAIRSVARKKDLGKAERKKYENFFAIKNATRFPPYFFWLEYFGGVGGRSMATGLLITEVPSKPVWLKCHPPPSNAQLHFFESIE